MKRSLLLTLLLLPGLALQACGEEVPVDDDTVHVVVTTAIWADVVRALDTDGAWAVEVLIPRGADPHDYAPSAAQVAMLARADLVIANGLGLEEGFEDVLLSAVEDGVDVLFLAPELSPLPFGTGDGGVADDHHALDPHVWLDPLRVADAARLIHGRLGGDGLDEFVQRIESLHEEILGWVSDVPDKRLVTNHDALGYFADRYGFEVIGTVIPGGSTTAEPSSKDLAALVDLMQETGVRVIFVDAGTSDVVATAVAREFGDDGRVVPLFTGTLADGDTLEVMLRRNARTITDILSGRDELAP